MSRANHFCRRWPEILLLLGLTIAGCGGQPQPKINDKPVPLPPAPTSVPTPSTPMAPTLP
jgi:hypothetical protein